MLQLAVILVIFINCFRLMRITIPVLRWASAAGALVCVVCVLREVDIESDGTLRSVHDFMHGSGRYVTIAIAVPVLTLYAHYAFRSPRALPRLLLGSHWGRLCLIGGVVVSAGALFEHELILDSVENRWEELLELNGYLLIALASFMPRASAEAAIETPLWSRRAPAISTEEEK